MVLENRLTEDPFIEVDLSDPNVAFDTSTGKVTVQFGSANASGPHGTQASLYFLLQPELADYRVETEQAAESPRATGVGAYHVYLPWSMLTPLLAILGKGTITATITGSSTGFFCHLAK